MKAVLYIILYWLIRKISSNLISLPLTNIGSTYSVFCIIGNSTYYKGVDIDQIQDVCWTDREQNLQENGLLIKKNELGTLYENIISFENEITLTHFPILNSNYMFERNTGYKRIGLSFSHTFTNESQSIVHQFKSIGLIENLSYSYTMNDTGNGLLFIGGIPPNLTEGKTYGECSIDPLAKEWSCQLSSVSLGGFTYNKKHDAYFQAGERYLRAPKEFMKYFVKTVLKEAIEVKDCFYGRDDFNTYCHRNVINKLNMITFTIGNYVYSFNASYFFEPYQNAGSKIRLNSFSDNTWIIGTFFLEHFSCFFDYDNQQVSLYLADNTIRDILIYPIDYSYMKVLFCMSSIILCIGSITILVNKYWRNKQFL